jgi:hypothetical protein
MPYNINNYCGSFLVSVQNSTICTTSTSLGLIGQNSVNFGLALNENFVYLLQNFSSSTPPASPIQGQIWYNNVTAVMNYYDGQQWHVLSPPFDGDAGTAQVLITAVNPQVEVTVIFSAGLIVSAVSHFALSPASLPLYAQIGDINFPFQSRFPSGISPGITLATDSHGYKFAGTATSANVLATGRCITLQGSVTGNVTFNGSNNVVLNTTLINALNGSVIANSSVTSLPNWFTNVYVNSNGVVSDATALIDKDVYNALGYTPASIILFNGDVHGNTVSNGTTWTGNIFINNQANITPGYYSNIYVGQNGLVVAANNNNAVPLQGIILWANPGLLPTGWALCNGQTITLPNGQTLITPDIPGINGTVYIINIGI